MVNERSLHLHNKELTYGYCYHSTESQYPPCHFYRGGHTRRCHYLFATRNLGPGNTITGWPTTEPTGGNRSRSETTAVPGTEPCTGSRTRFVAGRGTTCNTVELCAENND
jgi:hypothetical protein